MLELVSYEVVEGVFFEQCGVDGLCINVKIENNKSLIFGNVYRQQRSAFNTLKESFLNVLDILNEKTNIL